MGISNKIEVATIAINKTMISEIETTILFKKIILMICLKSATKSKSAVTHREAHISLGMAKMMMFLPLRKKL